MSTNEKNSHDISSDNPPANESSNPAGNNNSRRRLLKGALGTASVVAAVTSKPVLAGICTVSGFMSGNLSNNHDASIDCGGRSPGFWKSPNGIVNYPEGQNGETFLNVFGSLWQGNPMSANMGWAGGNTTPSLEQVLRMTGNEDQYQFGAHAVAAYLNAKYISGYGLVADGVPGSVVDLVSQVLIDGQYIDIGSGQTLDVIQLRDFIIQTFTSSEQVYP